MKNTSILFLITGLCAQAADLRLRTGDPLVVTNWSTSAPVTVTFGREHGLQAGDQLACHSIQGQQNLNSNLTPGQWQTRLVKTVVSATSVALTDASGVDIQPVPGAARHDLLSRVQGDQLGWCGRVQTYQTAPFPRGFIPQGGEARARIVNNPSSNPTIWGSLKTRFVDPFSTAGCDGTAAGLCSREESQIAAVDTIYRNPGLGQGDPVLTLALGWVKTGNPQYLNSVRYYLNNVHRYLHVATFAGCYSGLNHCGNGQTNDWGALALQRFAAAYSIVRDQLPVAERQEFANKMLNSAAGGCTNQMTGKLGELNPSAAGATTLTGTGLETYQVGDFLITAGDLATARGSLGHISSISVTGGVASVALAHPHRFRASRFVRISGTGSALDSAAPYVIAAVSGNTFTFAVAVADGTYSHANAVIEQFIFNSNEVLGRHRVTAVQAGSVTVTPALTAAQLGAEHRRLPRWREGNCGFVWYLEGHATFPATISNRWTFIRLAEAVTPDSSSIAVTTDTWPNAPPGTGWFVMITHSNGVTHEVLQVTGRDDAARRLTVARGVFGTAPQSRTAGATLHVRTSQPFGNSNVNPAYVNDWSSNLTWTRIPAAFNIGVALADDDPRARALAEASWAYARDLMIPFLERHWAGAPPAGGNEGYSFGRYAEMMARMELNLRNSLTSAPYSMIPMLGMIPTYVMHWSMGGDFRYMHYLSDSGSDSSIGQNHWTWLLLAHHFQPSAETANALFYWKVLLSGLEWNRTPDAAFAWLIYEDENYSGTDFRNERAPWYFARKTVAVSGARPHAYMDSRTNWTTNSTQILSAYPSDPVDHMGAYQSYGNYRIYKKALLMGPTDGLGGGVGIGVQPGIVDIRPFRAGNNQEAGIRVRDDMRYGSGTARFVRLDCLDCYWKPGDFGAWTTVPLTRHLRYIAHLPSGGQDYVIVYDDWAASSAIANSLLLPYWTREATTNVHVQSPYPAFSRTGGDIQFRSMRHNVSLLSKVLLPAAGAVTDNWAAVSAAPSSHFTVQVRAAPPNAASGEFLVVHRAIDGVTGTLPETELLTSGAAYRAIQVNDPGEAKVAVFPVGGARNNPSFTSTHAGQGRYLAAGLEPGAYRVRRGGVEYLAGLSVGEETGAIEFTGLAGSYEIERTGPAPAIQIATDSLPEATLGVAYSQSLAASGGTPPYSWSVVNGALCSGLSLSGAGLISGTPALEQVCSFTVRAADSAGASATRTLAIAVNSQPPQLAIVTSTPLPQGRLNEAYSTTLVASGGSPPYTWARTDGTFPTGLSLAGATGVISGTPLSAMTANFTIQVTDSAGATAMRTFQLVVAAADAGPSITTSELPRGEAGTAYSTALAASGGQAPYTWSAVSGFPAWLTLAASGALSGLPPAAGTFELTVAVTDALARSDQRMLALTIDPLRPPALEMLSGGTLPGGAVRRPYQVDLQATGGTPPYTWALAPGSVLPEGLQLSVAGELSGEPGAAGSSSFTIEVRDSGDPAQAASRQFTLFVSALPVVEVETTVAGTGVVVRYGNRALQRQESCRVVVRAGGATYYDVQDGGGLGRRFAYASGLPESSSGKANVTCGQSQGGSAFVTGQRPSGQVDVPIRLRPPEGLGATQVELRYGRNGPEHTILQTCGGGCTITLPMLDRDALYALTWNWQNAGGGTVSSASTMWIVAR
jgi:hypothetical protein